MESKFVHLLSNPGLAGIMDQACLVCINGDMSPILVRTLCMSAETYACIASIKGDQAENAAVTAQTLTTLATICEQRAAETNGCQGLTIADVYSCGLKEVIGK